MLLSVFRDRKMMLLAPMFAYSNFFYAVQFNALNGAIMDPRSSGLNNMFYWSAQIIGAIAIGKLHDTITFTIRKRAMITMGILFVFVTSTWPATIWIINNWTADKSTDFTMGSLFWKPWSVYFFSGFIDAFI